MCPCPLPPFSFVGQSMSWHSLEQYECFLHPPLTLGAGHNCKQTPQWRDFLSLFLDEPWIIEITFCKQTIICPCHYCQILNWKKKFLLRFIVYLCRLESSFNLTQCRWITRLMGIQMPGWVHHNCICLWMGLKKESKIKIRHLTELTLEFNCVTII